jgi:molybdate/tungstate transport system substrate-binding protein
MMMPSVNPRISFPIGIRVNSPFLLVMLAIFCLAVSCKNPGSGNQRENRVLSVFHAGSLSVPMKNLAEAFEKENPGVDVQLEASGSLAAVRKITELNRTCDVLALADYMLIDELLFPEYAHWNILFAANELCLVYTDQSGKADLINTGNWFDILLDPDIRYGRSDPDSDPCGYRTVLALMLADRYYPEGVEWQKLLEKDTRYIRGKETDLNALLESRTIDYMFNYRSVAVQHQFKYLTLPDSVNLCRPDLDAWYSAVSVDVRGTSPGSSVTQRGASIVYGLTIPTGAPNPGLAGKFVEFITDPAKGRVIIEQSGQTAIDPRYSKKSKSAGRFFN